MFKLRKSHVVIGNADRARALGTLLLPNGEHALVLDRGIYERALHSADEKFEEAAEGGP